MSYVSYDRLKFQNELKGAFNINIPDAFTSPALGLWDLSCSGGMRGMRDVRPDHSQRRGLMLDSEHYGNWILKVWLEASRLVYCSVSAENQHHVYYLSFNHIHL